MTTLNLQVGASTDDAAQAWNGSVYRTLTSDVYLDYREWDGNRFTNVQIPVGVIIDSATFQMYVPSTTYDNPDFDVYCQAADNPTTFTTTSNDISNRARTTAFGDWLGTNIGSGWKSAPDIYAAVQEVVSRPGWAAGNALAVILDCGSSVSCGRRWWDYAGNAYGAKLDIDYTPETVLVYSNDPSIEGLWFLDEESGTRYDETSNDNDLTDVNTVASSSDSMQGDRSADFESSNLEYLAITDGSQTGLDITWAISLVGWFKPETVATAALIGKYGDIPNRGYLLSISTNQVFFSLSSDGSALTTAIAATTLSAANWYHIAATYNGTNMRVYVNGVLSENGSDNPKTYPGGIYDPAVDFRLGTRVGSSLYYDGLMDEIAVFSRALSAAEVLSIFQNGIIPAEESSSSSSSSSTLSSSSSSTSVSSSSSSTSVSSSSSSSSTSISSSSSSASSSSSSTSLSSSSTSIPAIPPVPGGGPLPYPSKPVVEVYDHNQRQFRLSGATGIGFSNHYSEEGSGFGYLTFVLKRKIGYDYNDIGFGYRVKLRKGIANILFDGVITKIDETHGNEGDQITVGAVGWNSMLAFQIHNFVLSDRRLDHWTGDEVPDGSFRPDKFDHGTSWELLGGTRINGLQFKPRRNVDFEEDDYTYLRYTFEFGETAARLSFDYSVELPDGWPGSFSLVDDADTVLWSKATSGSGTLDLAIGTATSYVEFRFYVTDAGENTAEDNSVHGRASELCIYSTTDSIDTARVASSVLAYMADFGFSQDTSRLQATGYVLPQAAFDGDQTLADTLEWCAGFGGENYAPIAWGLGLDDERRMFVELQDLSTVRYVVPRSAALSATVSGDWAESAQKIYAVSQDEAGTTQRTSLYSNTEQVAKLGGMYRVEAVQVGQVSALQAARAALYRLSEAARPKITSSFSVSGPLRTPGGGRVPIDEIRAGGIVEIRDFRAREATMSPDDLRSGYTSFMLVGVEVDLDNNSATLIPAGDRSRFERYMTRLSQLSRGM